MSVFMIVGRNEPLYEADLSSVGGSSGSGGGSGGGRASGGEESAHLNQFIVHSALDMVERKQWSTPATYLRLVDKFNEQNVSAFLTAGGAKLMLLHDGRTDDAIRGFFSEVHELYVKLLMNPFYAYDSPVISPAFDQRVKALARKLL
ncbi:unnamed protein product [Scytosiphon promiscuus]